MYAPIVWPRWEHAHRLTEQPEPTRQPTAKIFCDNAVVEMTFIVHSHFANISRRIQKRQQATVYLDIQIESIDKAWLWDKNKHIYYYCFFGEGTSWTLWRGSLIPTLRASLRLTKASIAPTIRWSRGKFPSDGS